MGYSPFGLVCDPQDITYVGENKLEFSPDFLQRAIQDNRLKTPAELGRPITNVYRQLTPEERGYQVL